MKPNAATQMLDTIQRIIGLVGQIRDETIDTIDIPAVKILKETVCDYNAVSQALTLLSVYRAEILMNKMIRVLGICIDTMFRVSEEKWANPIVRKAFVAIDKIGANLETSWNQAQAWRVLQ